MGAPAHTGAHFIGRARRWFRRRSQRVRSALSQETRSRCNSISNSCSISNSSKQSEFSQKREKPKREKEIVEAEIEDEEEEQEEESKQVVEIEESGILRLKLIRVPLGWNMAGLDPYKKVWYLLFSFLLSNYICNDAFLFVISGSLWFTSVGFDCPAFDGASLFVGWFVFVCFLV